MKLKRYENPNWFLQEVIDGKLTFRIEMQNADLAQSKLYEEFNRQLRKAGGHLSLSYSILFRLRAPNAYLENAMLANTILQESDLSGAYLKNASFGSADLQGIILREADVEHCYFAWADFSEADLTNVKNIETADGLGLAQYWNTKADKHTQEIIEEAIAKAKEERWADSEYWADANRRSIMARREITKRLLLQQKAQRYSLDRFIDTSPS